MAYVSLYRKYRPINFDELIGQNHIRQILTNQIKTNNIGHCYLFNGTRGTGKTSVAKIFARSVNCLSLEKDGSPCNKCKNCISSLSGNNMDILELDAASNNGVDDVRELKSLADYPPQNQRFKIFIIDEVHMLTTNAFNALLKLLEEPPAHCIFILATTEMHKIPQTILSRCLTLDFRLVSLDDLIKKLQFIYNDCGVSCPPDCLSLIASKGEGSVRDVLSIADMCYAFCGNEITYEKVVEVLGVSDPKTVLSLLDSALTGENFVTLNKLNYLLSNGKSVVSIHKDLVYYISKMTYVKVADKATFDDIPRDIYETIKEIVKNHTISTLTRAVYIISSLEGQLRYTQNPQICLEACLLGLGDKTADIDSDKLLLRLKSLEEELNNLKNKITNGIMISPAASAFVDETEKTDKLATDTEQENVLVFDEMTVTNIKTAWGKVLLAYGEAKNGIMQMYAGNYSEMKITSIDTLTVTLSDDIIYAKFSDPINAKFVNAIFAKSYRLPVKVVFALRASETEDILKDKLVDSMFAKSVLTKKL